MKIEHEIKKINDHFVKKLVNGEFEIKKYESHTTDVEIDGYNFVLWTSSGEKHLKIWDSCGHNFMQLEFTDEEKKLAWEKIEKQRQLYFEVVARAQKIKQFNELKKELDL